MRTQSAFEWLKSLRAPHDGAARLPGDLRGDRMSINLPDEQAHFACCSPPNQGMVIEAPDFHVASGGVTKG